MIFQLSNKKKPEKDSWLSDSQLQSSDEMKSI